MIMLRFATARRTAPLVLMAAFALAAGMLASAETASAAPAPGQEENVAEDPEAIRPFTIDVPDAVLADLQDRLARTRLPDDLPGTEWDYGTNREYLEELLAYWQDEFKWRDQEWMLNGFDHFKTNIDGLDVHFIHQRSPHEDALPLVITHGWPGSIMEFYKIIPLLVDPTNYGGDAADAFHVVAPSIPGYGFSDKPTGRGYSPERMAEIIGKLMERLGYDRYGTQGGDWGSIISRWQAVQHPDRVVGVHLNMVSAGPAGRRGRPDRRRPPEELARSQARQEFFADERGYSNIQGTKPQTLGYGLNDSPAGLASWIVEKFRTWCDCDGDVESQFTKDELLTNITIYWANADHHLVDPHLLRVASRDQPAGLHRDAGRLRHLPEGAVHSAARVGRGGVQRDALDGNAARAGTSRRSRSRSCCPRTSARSSGSCGSPLGRRSRSAGRRATMAVVRGRRRIVPGAGFHFPNLFLP